MCISSQNDQLPQEIAQDMEIIARSVHESWMRQRQGEGWTYAAEFDNQLKTTPNMVDYDALPESEKEVDRATVRQVVRTLLKLHYRIGRE